MTAMDADTLRALAGDATGAWDRVVGAARSLPVATRATVRTAVRESLGVVGPELPEGERSDDGAAHPAVAAFARQLVVDVASVTPEQRTSAFAVLGAESLAFVQALYVADLGTRRELAFMALFGAPAPVEPAAGADLWTELEEFLAAVARLAALDPVTAELVRLRGAAAHACRLCQSIRNVQAQRLGADEALYGQLAGPVGVAVLTDRQRAAVELVDAMVWTPTAIPASVAAAVRANFTDEQAVELVLDVVRNAANKIAVAFAADEPHVTEGVELYDIDASGRLLYGDDVPAAG